MIRLNRWIRLEQVGRKVRQEFSAKFDKTVLIGFLMVAFLLLPGGSVYPSNASHLLGTNIFQTTPDGNVSSSPSLSHSARTQPLVPTSSGSSGLRENAAINPSVSWPGSVIGTFQVTTNQTNDSTIFVDGLPMASDPVTGYLYIALGDWAIIVNGTTQIGQISFDKPGLGSVKDFGYDSYSGEMYAAVFPMNTSPGSPGVIAIINGTSIVSTITSGVVSHPWAVVYDPSNGYIYVADENGSVVNVIGGNKVIDTIFTGYNPNSSIGMFFGGIAYDSANGYVYVTEYGQERIGVINGTQFIGNITLAPRETPMDIVYDSQNGLLYVTAYPFAVAVILDTKVVAQINDYNNTTAPLYLAFDSGNGFIYVSSLNTGVISVINGTSMIAKVPTGGIQESLMWMAFDPLNDYVYVTEGELNYSVIGTRISGTAVDANPAGSPLNSADVGQSVLFNTSFYARGIKNGSAFEDVSPTIGLGCPSNVTARILPTMANVSVLCTPTAPGIYLVALGVTDADNYSVASTLVFQVFSDPVAMSPTVIYGLPPLHPPFPPIISSADVLESVSFIEKPLGGSGSYTQYQWTGVVAGTCSGRDTATPECQFTSSGNVTVSVRITDTNGVTSSPSPPAFLRIYSLPVAVLPEANRSSADYGQQISFRASVAPGTGAPGNYEYSWVGLPPECLGWSGPTPSCTAIRVGNLSIQVIIFDSNGGESAPSPMLNIPVYSDPKVAAFTVAPDSIHIGRTVTLSVSVLNGSGNFNYTWVGLPSGCSGSAAEIACQPAQTGSYAISVIVTDANGYVLQSSTMDLLVLPSVSGQTILGLSPTSFYALDGIAVAATVAVVILVMRRRRGGQGAVPLPLRSMPIT